MDENVNPSQGTQSPMDRLGALLAAESAPADPQPQAEPEPRQASDEESNAPESESDTDNPFDPDPQPEGQAEEDNEELVEVELDGKTYRVPEAAKAAMMKDADYRKKTEEAATLRRHGEASIKQAEDMMQQVSRTSELLGRKAMLEVQLAAYQQVDWQTLRANDPQQYAVALAEAQALRGQLQAVVQEGSAAWEKFQAARKEQISSVEAATREAVKSRIKGWNAEANLKLGEYVGKVGVAEGSISALKTDPALVEMAWKAYQYDKAAAANPAAKKLPPPPVAKPGARPAQASQAQTSQAKAREQLRKTGSVHDAARLIKL